MSPKTTVEVAVSDGPFDHDACFAVAALTLAFRVKLVRTHDPLVMSQAQMRVGIGQRFELSAGDFDHDQHGAPYRMNGVKYAAFGLVWRQFGERICGTSQLGEAVDRLLVQPCDAAHTGNLPRLDQGPNPYSVASMLESLNPTWMERELDQSLQFDKAVRQARKILKRTIAVCRADIEAAILVRQAAALTDDPRILMFDKKFPWRKTVVHEFPSVLYVITRESDRWVVTAVPTEPDGLTLKHPLPADWAGKFGDELAALTGVPDALHCNTQTSVITAHSFEGAYQLAKLALD
ncbi:MYG1 family protein [Candidatus Uhrbacteria bacterium]|nr:MYG1 family protein [Candidatus Uhrbacteria bacterium]